MPGEGGALGGGLFQGPGVFGGHCCGKVRIDFEMTKTKVWGPNQILFSIVVVCTSETRRVVSFFRGPFDN